MALGPIADLSLVLDAQRVPGREGDAYRYEYWSTLFEGWSEDGKVVARQAIPALDKVVAAALHLSADACGATLFDWVCPPGSALRGELLRRCESTAEAGGSLRLWIEIGDQLSRFELELVQLDRDCKASWEGFFVREWADKHGRAGREMNPFLALNPWAHIVRRPSGLTVRRAFTVDGPLNVEIVVSNPPPGSPDHLPNVDPRDGTGTGKFLRVYRAFSSHPNLGWLARVRNPTKVDLARLIRDYKPHVLVYLGHGGVDVHGHPWLMFSSDAAGGVFERVKAAPRRRGTDAQSGLEQVFSGQWRTLVDPAAADDGLPVQQRPRIFIAFACKVAHAAPAILDSGIPAVLAMRREVDDTDATEAMVRHCAAVVTDPTKTVEEAVADLRQFLWTHEGELADARLHFSVPVLYLARLEKPAASLRRQSP